MYCAFRAKKKRYIIRILTIVSETIKCASDNDTLEVNSIESDMLYVSLMEYAVKHSEKTFNDVISELRLVHDTMAAGINSAIAIGRDSEQLKNHQGGIQ